MKTRYFGLGLSRTGTVSLYVAFRRLGFINVGHYLHPEAWNKLDDYVFVNDLPVPARFEELDKRYPGSRFIYNYRPVDSWLVSCKRMEQRLLNQGPYYDWMEQYNVEMYGAPYYDECLWRAAHAKHHEHVLDYFRQRPEDLLLMDITQGDGYKQLIPWIGWNNVRFPHANSTAEPNRPY